MIDALLARLDKVKQTGSGQYQACCPAHDDKAPSLGVREVDGKILINCLAGCYPQDVLDSVGLKWSDLFSDPYQAAYQSAVASAPRLKADPLAVEENVLLIAKQRLEAGERLSVEDQARVETAIQRVETARAE